MKRSWLGRTGSLLLVATQVLLELRPQDSKNPFVSGLFGTIAKFAADFSGEILALSVFLLFLGFALSKLKRDPEITRSIESILDETRRELFTTDALVSAPEMHCHRITVFKYSTWCFMSRLVYFRKFQNRRLYPWSGWLVPVARSGHITRDGKTVFHVDVNGAVSEGFAGRAYLRATKTEQAGGSILHATMPILTIGDPSSVKAYSECVYQSQDDVKLRHDRRPVQYGCLAAIPLCVAGRPWGAVVLDSVTPDGVILPQADGIKLYRQFTSLLDRFIQRW